MNIELTFYICPTCFEVFDTNDERHPHPLIRCACGGLDDARRKPPMEGGRLRSRAPQWFLEAVGWLPPRNLTRVIK